MVANLVVSYKVIEDILQSYSLEEIIEYNDKTPEDVLDFLVDEKYLELPDVQPLEFED